MSRHNYSCDFFDPLEVGRFHARLKSTLYGRRGQAFLREMRAALLAMPEKRLIAGALEEEGAVCAMGCVGRARNLDLSGVAADDPEQVAKLMGISPTLVREIAWNNDDEQEGGWGPEDFDNSPEAQEERYGRVLRWIERNLKEATP